MSVDVLHIYSDKYPRKIAVLKKRKKYIGSRNILKKEIGFKHLNSGIGDEVSPMPLPANSFPLKDLFLLKRDHSKQGQDGHGN